MRTALVLGCVWVLAATLVAMLPMRRQLLPGLALLLAAPVLLLSQGARAIALANGQSDSGVALAVGLAAALYGGYLWSGCVAAAHGLSSARPVYGVAAGALAGVLAAGWLAVIFLGAGAA